MKFFKMKEPELCKEIDSSSSFKFLNFFRIFFDVLVFYFLYEILRGCLVSRIYDGSGFFYEFLGGCSIFIRETIIAFLALTTLNTKIYIKFCDRIFWKLKHNKLKYNNNCSKDSCEQVVNSVENEVKDIYSFEGFLKKHNKVFRLFFSSIVFAGLEVLLLESVYGISFIGLYFVLINSVFYVEFVELLNRKFCNFFAKKQNKQG